MPIYDVTIHYISHESFQVEAKDEEHAEEVAQEMTPNNRKEIEENEEIDQYDVSLADCQYTDQQELEDRENAIQKEK